MTSKPFCSAYDADIESCRICSSFYFLRVWSLKRVHVIFVICTTEGETVEERTNAYIHIVTLTHKEHGEGVADNAHHLQAVSLSTPLTTSQ